MTQSCGLAHLNATLGASEPLSEPQGEMPYGLLSLLATNKRLYALPNSLSPKEMHETKYNQREQVDQGSDKTNGPCAKPHSDQESTQLIGITVHVLGNRLNHADYAPGYAQHRD
jgi:hypothetical protein